MPQETLLRDLGPPKLLSPAVRRSFTALPLRPRTRARNTTLYNSVSLYGHDFEEGGGLGLHFRLLTRAMVPIPPLSAVQPLLESLAQSGSGRMRPFGGADLFGWVECTFSLVSCTAVVNSCTSEPPGARPVCGPDPKVPCLTGNELVAYVKSGPRPSSSVVLPEPQAALPLCHLGQGEHPCFLTHSSLSVIHTFWFVCFPSARYL